MAARDAPAVTDAVASDHEVQRDQHGFGGEVEGHRSKAAGKDHEGLE